MDSDSPSSVQSAILLKKRSRFRALNLMLMLVTCYHYGHPTLDLNRDLPVNSESTQGHNRRRQPCKLEGTQKYLLKVLEGAAQILVQGPGIVAVTAVLTEGGSGLARPPFSTPILQLNCVTTHSASSHQEQSKDNQPTAPNDSQSCVQNSIAWLFRNVAKIVFYGCKNPTKPKSTNLKISLPEELPPDPPLPTIEPEGEPLIKDWLHEDFLQ
jgi:hypothetical protein